MKKGVYILVFLTGFSSLIFQVVWQKYLAILLGGEALSSALVVAFFLGGLACGYAWFGRRAIGVAPGKLLVRAGFAELGIGAWGCLYVKLFRIAWTHVTSFPAEFPWRIGVDLGLSILLLSPATFLMANTLPLLTRALSARREELSLSHARIYGINTVGAVAGALSAGFVLIERFGLSGTLITASGVSLSAGVALVALGMAWRSADENPAEKEQPIGISPSTRAVAFISGFASIGFEILLMRMMSLAIGSFEYVYGLVVATFVLMIAFGALTLGKSGIRPVSLLRNQIWVIGGLIFVYVTMPKWGQIAHIIRWSLPTSPQYFYVYYFSVFLALGALAAIPVFFMGRVMPLLFNDLRAGLDSAPMGVGQLYAANAMGCALGGLTMGYGLLTVFNAHFVYRVGIFLCVTNLALLALRLDPPRRRRYYAAGLGLFALAVALPAWPEKEIASGAFRADRMSPRAFSWGSEFTRQLEYGSGKGSEILYYRDDPDTSVAVFGYDGERNLVVNGKSDGATAAEDQLTTSLLGYLPALFAAAPGDAAVIGLGLGNTADSVASVPWIERADVYEISKAVIDAVPLFKSVNHEIWKNPKVAIHWTDGFRGLMRGARPLSIIISEPSNPWISGIDRLYSREFYEIAKARMRPDGIFCQWMHTYRLSPETLAMVLRTFHSVFPQVKIFGTKGEDLILLGSQRNWDDAIYERARRRWDELNLSEKLRPLGVDSFVGLALKEESFPFPIADAMGEVNSLFVPRLSYSAAKDYYLQNGFSLRVMNLISPLFAYEARLAWKDSMANFLVRSNRMNGADLFQACQGVRGGEAKTGEIRFKMREIDSTCQMWALSLTSRGALKPGSTEPNIEKPARALALLSQGSDSWDQELSFQESTMLLSALPPWEKAPPAELLDRIHGRCSVAADRRSCSKVLVNLSIKFGYSEMLKTWLSSMVPGQISPAEKLVLKRSIAQLGLMR